MFAGLSERPSLAKDTVYTSLMFPATGYYKVQGGGAAFAQADSLKCKVGHCWRRCYRAGKRREQEGPGRDRSRRQGRGPHAHSLPFLLLPLPAQGPRAARARATDRRLRTAGHCEAGRAGSGGGARARTHHQPLTTGRAALHRKPGRAQRPELPVRPALAQFVGATRDLPAVARRQHGANTAPVPVFSRAAHRAGDTRCIATTPEFQPLSGLLS
jgi:hypothetical protein